MTINNPRPTKNERREAARAKAAASRAAEKRREKTKKIVTWASVGVGIVAVGALVTSIIFYNNSLQAEASVTSPNNMATDGIILLSPTTVLENKGYNLEDGTPLSSATLLEDSPIPHVEVYYDYSCPHCKVFEDDNAVYLEGLLDQKKITLEHKPMLTIGNQYSFAGANAAACIANYAPEKFSELHSALFANNPDGNALPATVGKILNSLDLPDGVKQGVKACQASDVFFDWQTVSTTHAQERTLPNGEKAITGTPSIFIDGEKYPFNPSMLQQFLNEVLDGADPAELVAEMSAMAAESKEATPQG